MTKLENEAELVKEALRVGMNYAEKRGVAKFEQTDSANDRLEYVYRLLVHDKVIPPLPNDKLSQKAIRHRLAMWIAGLKEKK